METVSESPIKLVTVSEKVYVLPASSSSAAMKMEVAFCPWFCAAMAAAAAADDPVGELTPYSYRSSREPPPPELPAESRTALQMPAVLGPSSTALALSTPTSMVSTTDPEANEAATRPAGRLGQDGGAVAQRHQELTGHLPAARRARPEEGDGVGGEHLGAGLRADDARLVRGQVEGEDDGAQLGAHHRRLQGGGRVGRERHRHRRARRPDADVVCRHRLREVQHAHVHGVHARRLRQVRDDVLRKGGPGHRVHLRSDAETADEVRVGGDVHAGAVRVHAPARRCGGGVVERVVVRHREGVRRGGGGAAVDAYALQGGARPVGRPAHDRLAKKREVDNGGGRVRGGEQRVYRVQARALDEPQNPELVV
eukprot:678030-Prorocentrum_minimum.AAC.2